MLNGYPSPLLVTGAPTRSVPVVLHSGRTEPKPGAAKCRTAPPAPLQADDELRPWREAAKAFEMNTDFDVVSHLAGRRKSLQQVIEVMKARSGGKGTIQALGDKIILSKLLENLGVPQMPVLFSTYRTIDRDQIESLVWSLENSTAADAYDIVVKPTHLSNAMGALILSKDRWHKDGWSASKLIEHMETYLASRAADCESEALKSLIPGFIVQPRYRSSVAFSFPLELRVVTLWGKARVGIWWWGREGAEPKGSRTSWLVRCPKHSGKLSNEDSWEALHEHVGGNRGFEVALDLFTEHMPAMAAAAEAIAQAVGAPFLRSDFFVGSAKWGVRLNEVAYGTGLEYRIRAPDGSQKLVDDSNVIAQILQDGFGLCKRKPPEHFLATLGATNSQYEAPDVEDVLPAPVMTIQALHPEERKRELPEAAVQQLLRSASPGARSNHLSVTAASCETQPGPDFPVRCVSRPVLYHGQGQRALLGPQTTRMSGPVTVGTPVMSRICATPPVIVPVTRTSLAASTVAHPRQIRVASRPVVPLMV